MDQIILSIIFVTLFFTCCCCSIILSFLRTKNVTYPANQ